MFEAFLKCLESISGVSVLFGETLAEHTTFKIGGKARAFVYAYSIDGLKRVIKLCEANGEKFFVIGAGSNCLFSDSGFNGVIISLEKMLEVPQVSGDMITISAGSRLSTLLSLCVKNGLTGLEWAMGIPASVGGAIFMNAGAYGGEIANNIVSVWVLSGGKVKKIHLKECNFSYRTSRFQTSGEIILKACFKFIKISSKRVLENSYQALVRRQQSQPAGASAGSVFKRFCDLSAGKIIDDCGLKGRRVGGAVISDKHANFILNTGGATCADVLELINIIKKSVYERFSICLETEIIYVGENYENSRGLPHS